MDLPVALTVSGEDAFSGLANRLNAAAAELATEVDAAVARAVESLPSELRASAQSTLPRRGGLAESVANSTIAVSHHNSAGIVDVTVTASSPYDIDEMDHGIVHHPLFGDKNHWYTESVNPGWWSRPVGVAQRRVEPEIAHALDVVARRIEG